MPRQTIQPTAVRYYWVWAAPGKGGRSVCLLYFEDHSWDLVRQGHLSVGTSQVARAGRGLFARRLIPKDGVVAPYTGEVIDSEKLTARYGGYTAPYALSFKSATRFVDAAGTRGVAAMANDAAGSNFQNNAVFVERDNGLEVVAQRDIRAGEEVFIDYRGAVADREAGVYDLADGGRHAVVALPADAGAPGHAEILRLLGLAP